MSYKIKLHNRISISVFSFSPALLNNLRRKAKGKVCKCVCNRKPKGLKSTEFIYGYRLANMETNGISMSQKVMFVGFFGLFSSFLFKERLTTWLLTKKKNKVGELV